MKGTTRGTKMSTMKVINVANLKDIAAAIKKANPMAMGMDIYIVIMKTGKRLTSFLLFALIAAGCTHESDLERMHIYGDVEKIETVTLTNIPIMEYYLNNNPQECIAYLDGNYILTFNSKGNVTKFQGFGCDMDNLFIVSPKCRKRIQSVLPLYNIPLVDIFDSIAYEYSEQGDLSLIEWYDDNKLVIRTLISYDFQQRICRYVTKRVYLGDWGSGDKFLVEDTTYLKYMEIDECGNWTEMEVARRCAFMPEQNNFTYRVLRQITYRGEGEKRPLMQQLHVQQFFDEQNQLSNHTLKEVQLGHLARIRVPNYMIPSNVVSLKDYMKEINGDSFMLDGDLCRYEYSGKSFASFSVSYFADAATGWDELTDQEKVFDQDVDDVLRMQYETTEAQKLISLLKWYPYSFVDINGHCAILTRYIRCGNGTHIPVYVENYLLDTPDGGAITISMSYQINQRKFFHQDFTNAVRSLIFD